MKSEGLLVCIEDSQAIPSVALEPSPKGYKPLTIKISQYRTASFMKVETHFYTLEVQDPNQKRQYQIERRFSDFLDLHETIFYNHPGYILPPFPGKTLQSFIHLKLGIGNAEPGERCELIEKRMNNLERFVNDLTSHEQLSNCEQFLIFLEGEAGKYEAGKKRLDKYVEEYKNLEHSSQWKTLLEKGKQLWTLYFKDKSLEEKSTSIKQSVTLTKADLQFQIFYEEVRSQQQRISAVLRDMEKLFRAEKMFSEFRDFETDNDIVLKICAKQSSSKEYCRRFSDYLELSIIEPLALSQKCLEEVEKNLIYRLNIVSALGESKKDSAQPEKQHKLERRLERFERNFKFDWLRLRHKVKDNNKEVFAKIRQGWEKHKQGMQKVWKARKGMIQEVSGLPLQSE